MSTWHHLVHFVATNGNSYFSSVSSFESADELIGLTIVAYPTFHDLNHGQNNQEVTIERLLAPIPEPDGDIICIGVNYREHAREANLTVPEDPVMWYKPRKAFGGHGDVEIPEAAANGFLDFEVCCS